MEWNCLCPPVHLCYNDEHLYLTCKEASTWNFSDRNALVCLFVCFLGEGLRQVLQLIILSAYCCSRTSSPLAHRQLGQAPAPRPPVQGQGGGMDSWVDGGVSMEYTVLLIHTVVDAQCYYIVLLTHSDVDTQCYYIVLMTQCYWHTVLLTNRVVDSFVDTVLLTHNVITYCCWHTVLLRHNVIT